MTHAEKATEITARYQREVERVRGDGRLSPQGKAKAIAKAYVDARDAVATVRQEAADFRVTERKRLESRLFHTATTAFPSDEAARTASYRDAVQRASRTADDKELRKMLELAELTGDSDMARAVAAIAVSRGDRGTLNEFVAQHPDTLDDLQQLSDLYTPTFNTATMVEAMALSGPQPPPEIGTINEDALLRLADLPDRANAEESARMAAMQALFNQRQTAADEMATDQLRQKAAEAEERAAYDARPLDPEPLDAA